MAAPANESQEQSIKERKQQLYETAPKVVVKKSTKSFDDFLRETPATPLSGGMKAGLMVVGVVVVVLLAAALLKLAGGPKKPVKTVMYHRFQATTIAGDALASS